MTLKYEPSKLIKKLKLKRRAAELVTPNLSLNRAALRAITELGVLPEKAAETVALKVIKEMRATAKDLRAEGATAAEAKEAAANDGRKMAARVQSAVLREQTRVIQKAYRGELYVWLPSTAANPRDEHIPNYGKIFQLGVGDADGNDPGDLPGCQCGMELLVDDTPDEFNERLEEVF